jgi:hypothetical protein
MVRFRMGLALAEIASGTLADSRSRSRAVTSHQCDHRERSAQCASATSRTAKRASLQRPSNSVRTESQIRIEAQVAGSDRPSAWSAMHARATLSARASVGSVTPVETDDASCSLATIRSGSAR